VNDDLIACPPTPENTTSNYSQELPSGVVAVQSIVGGHKSCMFLMRNISEEFFCGNVNFSFSAASSILVSFSIYPRPLCLPVFALVRAKES
jgi:hypothetical protein